MEEHNFLPEKKGGAELGSPNLGMTSAIPISLTYRIYQGKDAKAVLASRTLPRKGVGKRAD